MTVIRLDLQDMAALNAGHAVTDCEVELLPEGPFNGFAALAAATREMRFHQKAFYRAQRGTPERAEALEASRQAERKVDELLAVAFPDPQRKLF